MSSKIEKWDALPAPAGDKSGWPWTQESEPLEVKLSREPWPKISIVTPSYNQGEFIEETIRSVLLQGYPNLEYIIIDGGSNDHSVDIIKRYEPWLSYWVSERDRGQAHALNKGFNKATGDILSWLNSDDFYLPGALAFIGRELSTADALTVLHGDAYMLDEQTKKKRPLKTHPVKLNKLIWHHEIWQSKRSCMPCQPAVAWSAEMYRWVRPLDETLELAMDFDLWLRMLRAGARFRHSREVLAVYRIHRCSKSNAGWESFVPEWRRVNQSFLNNSSPAQQRILRLSLLKEKLCIALDMKREGARELVSSAHTQRNISSGWVALARAAARYPPIALTRYFWGSLRRLIL